MNHSASGASQVSEAIVEPQPVSTPRMMAKGLLLAVSIFCGVVAAALSQASSPDYHSLFLGVLQLWGVHLVASVVLYCVSSKRSRRFYPIYLVAMAVVALPIMEMATRVL